MLISYDSEIDIVIHQIEIFEHSFQFENILYIIQIWHTL